MNEATQVLKNFRWDGSLPIPVFDIASDYALVLGEDLTSEGLSGQCFASHPRNNGGPLIIYNIESATSHQKFTVAHELGHIVLNHGDALRDPTKNFNRYNFDPKEVQANQFAAELLMPISAINYYLGEVGEYSLERLSRIFGVSQMAINIRLKNLGFING